MVVSNATAPIIFARLERLDLLQHAYGTLIVPEEVDRELTQPDKTGGQAIAQADWIRTEPVQDRSFLDQLPESLDDGEAEAIALARAQGAVLLTDDKDARRIARQHGLCINSSLTVLHANKASGNLQHVKPLLDRMLAHHFRLSRRVYDEFLVQVDESPDEGT